MHIPLAKLLENEGLFSIQSLQSECGFPISGVGTLRFLQLSSLVSHFVWDGGSVADPGPLEMFLFSEEGYSCGSSLVAQIYPNKFAVIIIRHTKNQGGLGDRSSMFHLIWELGQYMVRDPSSLCSPFQPGSIQNYPQGLPDPSYNCTSGNPLGLTYVANVVTPRLI